MSNYSIGICKICDKTKALKDGVCASCEYSEPSWIEDLFGRPLKDNDKEKK